MSKKDLILWVVLITLTLVGYFSSITEMEKMTLILSLLVVTIVKFIGVGFQFMELKKAHIFWKVSLVALLSVYVLLVFMVS